MKPKQKADHVDPLVAKSKNLNNSIFLQQNSDSREWNIGKNAEDEDS
jgi:hypothetical protein